MVSEERLVELGELLQRRREELGLRRSDVARRVDVTPAYVARIEDAAPRPTGQRTRPSESVLARWTKALALDATARIRVLNLAGYAMQVDLARGESRGIHETERAYRVDPDLVEDLRQVLERAAMVGEVTVVEEVLRPVLALLRDRFTAGD